LRKKPPYLERKKDAADRKRNTLSAEIQDNVARQKGEVCDKREGVLASSQETLTTYAPCKKKAGKIVAYKERSAES